MLGYLPLFQMQIVENGEQIVEEFQTQYGRDVDRRKSYGGLGCFHGNESPFYRSRGGHTESGCKLGAKNRKAGNQFSGLWINKGEVFQICIKESLE